MLEAMKYVGCWVSDQDEAVAFYTEKLGFEVREDVTFGEGGSYRWLIVGPPGDAGPGLILSRPGPPAMDEATGKQVLELVAKGAMGGGIFHTADCRATCQELEGRGLELSQQPEERFYGIDAAFRDPAGNQWRIVQPTEYDEEAMKKFSG